MPPKLARRSGGAVGALDDGLAPEHRLPTAVELDRVRGVTDDLIKMGGR